MSGDVPATGEGSPEKGFSVVRKGYARDEVNERLAEYEVAVRDLEEYAAQLKQELSESRAETKRLQDSEQEAVDRAMLAVFDSKQRILDRARQKAAEIENEARRAAGEPTISKDELELEDDDRVDVQAPAAPAAPGPAFSQPVEAPAGVPPEVSQDEPQPADILRQMLEEADTIRDQLEQGLSSAFEEISRMQTDAETRATEMLSEARSEAERLRSAGEAGSGSIEVTLPAKDDPTESEIRSRFARNSAKLPRIGEPDGVSVLASMNQLRSKLREAEEAALKVQDTAS